MLSEEPEVTPLMRLETTLFVPEQLLYRSFGHLQRVISGLDLRAFVEIRPASTLLDMAPISQAS
jgi:hypothetical protein